MAQEKNLHIEFIKEKLSDFNELTDDDDRFGSEETEEEGSTGSHIVVNGNECYHEDAPLNLVRSAKKKRKRHRVDDGMTMLDSRTEKVLQTINYDSAKFETVSEVETLTPSLDWVRVDDSLDTEINEDEMSAFTSKTSMDSLCKVEDLILVRFSTRNGETMTSNFKATSKIFDLKERVAKVFKITTDDFDLFQGELECEDSMVLSDFIVSSAPVDFVIRSQDCDTLYDPGEFSSYRPFKQLLTVRIPLDMGGHRLKTVLIENHCFAKEWLGGYSNKLTLLEYHHAVCQTEPKRRPPRALPLLSHATQTKSAVEKNTETDTIHDKATQMWRLDHYIPSVNDKLVKADPKRFESSKIVPSLKRLFRFAVTSQAYNRTLPRWRIRSMENNKKSRCSKTEIENEKQRLAEQLERNKRLVVDSTFPMNREDFYLLYLLIGKWWRESYKRLRKMKNGAALKSVLMRLLREEVDLIWMIERKRIKAKRELLMRQQMYFVENCARPIIFRDNKGVMSSVDALSTQQARELLEMMSSYLNPKITAKQRVDSISTLKEQLKIYGSFEDTDEIIELLDRESDLILMGLSRNQLKTLRNRTMQLLLQRLRSANVNPASAKYKRPCMPKTDFKHYMCVYCKKLKHACDYTAHIKMTSFTMCSSCLWLMNIGLDRINFTPFARMLSDVRQSEMTKCCSSSVCFVLQTVGMHYLVCQIWLAKSILSAKTDLNRLRIVRFRKEEDWSPWNCILLTVEECAVHAAIEEVDQFYNKDLLDIIHWRHLRAKDHFMPLRLNDKFMQEANLWPNVQDTGNFLHPNHIVKFAESPDFEYYD